MVSYRLSKRSIYCKRKHSLSQCPLTTVIFLTNSDSYNAPIVKSGLLCSMLCGYFVLE
ncbi:MAG: hypothetical protein LBC74_11225 [Planctomycetaceae bacterium]|nr:hypothetical protein [Planctomycetaceae bacterium]